MFPRKNRLKRTDVREVMQKGAVMQGRFFRLRVLRKSYAEPQFTVIVNNKTAKGAAARNRLKRRTREAVKKASFAFSYHSTAVFPSKETEKAKPSSLVRELQHHGHTLQNKHLPHQHLSKNRFTRPRSH